VIVFTLGSFLSGIGRTGLRGPPHLLPFALPSDGNRLNRT